MINKNWKGTKRCLQLARVGLQTSRQIQSRSLGTQVAMSQRRLRRFERLVRLKVIGRKLRKLRLLVIKRMVCKFRPQINKKKMQRKSNRLRLLAIKRKECKLRQLV
jgi:hypothetical protein